MEIPSPFFNSYYDIDVMFVIFSSNYSERGSKGPAKPLCGVQDVLAIATLTSPEAVCEKKNLKSHF